MQRKAGLSMACLHEQTLSPIAGQAAQMCFSGSILPLRMQVSSTHWLPSLKLASVLS